MSAIPYDESNHDADDSQPDELIAPGRPRRQFFNRKTAAVAALVTCAAGFLGGIEIEKSQATGITTAAPAGAAGPTGAAGATGAHTGFPFSGRLGGGGSGASFGTVSSVDGSTLYVTEASGNTVKAKLSSATKITKSKAASKSSLRPGDTVVIQGASNSNGTIAATSVSDSGASAARSGTGSGTSGAASTTNSAGTTG